MRGYVRRLLLAATFAALAVLATNGTSSCRAKAEELKPTIVVPEKPVQHKEGEIIYEPQDPCNWQDWPWWVRVVIGCTPAAGGGGSGAGMAKPSGGGSSGAN